MKRLKDLREDHDLTQADVAQILGISQQYYQCYESGKNEVPLRHCITLAKYYDVSLDYIAGLSSLPRSTVTKGNPTLEKYEKLIEEWEKSPSNVKEAIKLLLYKKTE